MFWRLALATCLRLDSVAKIACFAQIGWFLNVFNFFPWTSVTVHCLPYLKHSQTHRVTHWTNFHFYIISTQNIQEKGMSFLFFSTNFMFYVLFTWICELLIWFEIFVVSVMGWMNVCCAWIFWVLLIRLLGFYFCFYDWYWLSVSIDPFDVWISYPLYYDSFWFTVMHLVCVFDWFKMVVFRWLGYLFKLFMVIMCVASVLWILFALCWLEHFILFMPYLIVICPLLVKCALHWVWGTFGSLQLINACRSMCLVLSPRAFMFEMLCSLFIVITMCYVLVCAISFNDFFFLKKKKIWIWS